jgi:rhamnosyl/mannosyltransferase
MADKAGKRERPLRVCHLAKFYHPASGGIETHLRTLAQAQAALGAEVHVLCVNHQDAAGRDVTFQRFARTETVEGRDGPVRVVRAGRQASLARFDLCLSLPRLMTRLAARRFDLLHLHVPNPTMLLLLAAVRPAAAVVITYHSDVVRQRRLARLLRPVEHLVFRKARAVLATSPAYADGSELLRAYRDRVRVVPFGIELRPYTDPDVKARSAARWVRQEYGWPLWLAVGRLVYYKGLHNALRALARVPGRLLVVGDGPLGGELRRLAAEAGVADRVAWRGRLSESDLIGAYHAATALWFPSNARSEAFGFVQVEAMASGCPVLNSAIPASGVPWVSRHEESGLTAPVDDPEALARAALRLLSEPGLRERLGHAARARAVAEFDAGVMARRTLDVYASVLQPRGDADLEGSVRTAPAFASA